MLKAKKTILFSTYNIFKHTNYFGTLKASSLRPYAHFIAQTEFTPFVENIGLVAVTSASWKIVTLLKLKSLMVLDSRNEGFFAKKLAMALDILSYPNYYMAMEKSEEEL